MEMSGNNPCATGPAQASNPLAMPLASYMDEVIQILSATPDVSASTMSRRILS